MAPIYYAACIPLIGYLCVVRFCRWRKYYAIHQKYQTKYQDETLTPEEAQEIVHVSAFYDMPFLLNYALAFALFKTYAVPSISKLLIATNELGNQDRVSKRYADSELRYDYIATWVACPISGFLPKSDANEADPRAMVALARVNWLHSRYKIKNDDYLYTLCLFALEPATWAERYGWRALSPLELYAYYVFWKEIGIRMGIQDIPESIDAMRTWSRAYEAEYMVPAQTNHDVAGYTVEELLYALPERFGIKNLGKRITTCLLDEPVRIAMMQPAQPRYLHFVARMALQSMHFAQRWFCLPRSSFGAVVDMRPPKITAGLTPRLRPTRYQVRPWYKPQSGGLGYYIDRLAVAVGYYSEMPGPHLRSGGYRLEEMGPLSVENSAHEKVMEMAAELQGCPVTGPWSLAGRCDTDIQTQ
ncbi:hypothetical protein BD779DRAFT_1444405 [Infundibulicybe gibba]|nr:hypothetical protein BD779DRAFT_1444405 [Infundibulicybe gibba]